MKKKLIEMYEGAGDSTHPVDLTEKELHMIAGWASEYRENDSAQELLDKVERALSGHDSDSSSMSMSVSKKTPFGGM